MMLRFSASWRWTQWLTVCALSGSALAALHGALGASAKDKIVFDPKVPSKVAKLFTVEHHLALQSLKLEDNGVEQLAQQGLNLDTKQTLRTLDEYKRCSEGRPTLLSRRYEDADLHVDVTFREGNGSDTVGQNAVEGKSRFEGLSVLFTWVPEEKGYGKLYDLAEGDESFLPSLSEDLDMRAVLPGHEVAPGDEWSIEPALVVDWVAPGGYLPNEFERKKDDRFVRTLNLGVGGCLSMVFGGDVKGRVTARYEGTEKQGETSVAVIALTVGVETDRDQTPFAQNMVSAAEILDGVRVRQSSVQWKLDAQGKVRWNTSANRFESFELAGREEVAYELTLSTVRGGKSLQKMTMSGGLRAAGQAGPSAAKAKEKPKVESQGKSAKD